MPDELVAVFADPDAAASALRALRDAGVPGVRVVEPGPLPGRAPDRTARPLACASGPSRWSAG